MLNLCDPVLASPITIAKGLAAICWSEKPRPTINNPDIIKMKEAVLAAG